MLRSSKVKVAEAARDESNGKLAASNKTVEKLKEDNSCWFGVAC